MRVARMLVAASVLAAGLMAPAARTQAAFPDKPVHLIVPFGPGGSTDLLSRLLAERLRENLGQPVIVENRPGANTAIAAKLVASSPPDGSILLIVAGTFLTVPATNPSAFDPINSFTPIGPVANVPLILVVRAESPFKTLADLITYAKANPGKLTKGSSALGGTDHLALELLKLRAGVDILVVPYKGAAEALNDLLAGVIDMRIDALPSSLPFMNSGKLRALGVTELTRSKLVPTVPTFAESGLPGFEAKSFFGIVGPKDTPPDIVKRLNADLTSIVSSPEVADRMRTLGLEPFTSSPEAFDQLIKRTFELWSNVIEKAGIKIR